MRTFVRTLLRLFSTFALGDLECYILKKVSSKCSLLTGIHATVQVIGIILDKILSKFGFESFIAKDKNTLVAM